MPLKLRLASTDATTCKLADSLCSCLFLGGFVHESQSVVSLVGVGTLRRVKLAGHDSTMCVS
jgi:hypothetical protein